MWIVINPSNLLASTHEALQNDSPRILMLLVYKLLLLVFKVTTDERVSTVREWIKTREKIKNGNALPLTKVVDGVETTIAPTNAEEKA
ncbi:hypothetical protein Tco_0099114 [Tanacetum coccineum]